MSRFLPYRPDQAYLLPPSVKDVLGEDHLCFAVDKFAQHIDFSCFVEAYGEEGGSTYAPEMMVRVWLYAFLLGVNSSRRLEQRIREDLAFRYLAGGAEPDYWALNQFRKRHGRGVNDLFTQVLERASELGLVRLGHVAIDSTRIQANASRYGVDSRDQLRRRRARYRREIRRWQKQCEEQDPGEGAGMTIGKKKIAELERKLEELPERLEKLKKSGLKRRSPVDEQARFLRVRGGYVLGYTPEIAVSEDHLVVAYRVTQNPTDNSSLIPMVRKVKQASRRCRQKLGHVLADAGYFSERNLEAMERQQIDAYVPDSMLAKALRTGGRIREAKPVKNRLQKKMRCKLRSSAGREIYRKRGEIAEPVFGVIKQQRGMRQFRYRGLNNVNTEFGWTLVAFNLGRVLALLKQARRKPSK